MNKIGESNGTVYWFEIGNKIIISRQWSNKLSVAIVHSNLLNEILVQSKIGKIVIDDYNYRWRKSNHNMIYITCMCLSNRYTTKVALTLDSMKQIISIKNGEKEHEISCTRL